MDNLNIAQIVFNYLIHLLSFLFTISRSQAFNWKRKYWNDSYLWKTVYDCVQVGLWACVCLDSACVSHMTDSGGVSAISGWRYEAGTCLSVNSLCVLPNWRLIRTVAQQHFMPCVYTISTLYKSLFHFKFDFLLTQRRGAISYDSSDQTALYIRMLGKYFSNC